MPIQDAVLAHDARWRSVAPLAGVTRRSNVGLFQSLTGRLWPTQAEFNDYGIRLTRVLAQQLVSTEVVWKRDLFLVRCAVGRVLLWQLRQRIRIATGQRKKRRKTEKQAANIKSLYSLNLLDLNLV